MRKTKIVCTVGPASEDPAILRELCLSGMNAARLNFSHGTHEEHRRRIESLKALRGELGLPVAIMLDTKGPECRLGTFRGGETELHDGDGFTLTTRQTEGDGHIVSVSCADFPEGLAAGDRVLINDGLVVLEVTAVEGTEAHCRTLTGGVLSDRKSVSFPGRALKQPYLSEQDKADLLFGIENGVDFVAASFVSCRQDLLDLKSFLAANGGGDIDVIAKIENRSGVDNIDEICTACEGIMVARGDLGVEIPYAELPAIQKYLIRKCRRLGLRVITATEMLESMVRNPRPTRAESSDVANAVYDGSSAVMLSAESASGRYPVESVRAMRDIIEETEKHVDSRRRFRTGTFEIRSRVDAISHAACTMAVDLGAQAIVVTSISGLTVRMVSRFRAPVDIVGAATNQRVLYKLALSWGVLPVLTERYSDTETLARFALRAAQRALGLKTGDTVVMTLGDTAGTSGSTNVVRIDTVQ